MSDQKIRLGGLWKNVSKNGLEYLGGKFGQARLLVFKNDDKRSENAPDFTMYLVPDERESTPTTDTKSEAPVF